MEEKIKASIVESILAEAEIIKGETEAVYGANSVETESTGNGIEIRLKGKGAVFRELGSTANPPNPVFYRTYSYRREKFLKIAAQMAAKAIADEMGQG